MPVRSSKTKRDRETLGFQPSIKREQIESLHELGFVDRRANEATGNLSRRLRVLAHRALLVVDEIGYLPVSQDGAVLFLPAHQRPPREGVHRADLGQGLRGMGGVPGDEVMAAALIDRLVYHCHTVNIRGNSYVDTPGAQETATGRRNPPPSRK